MLIITNSGQCVFGLHGCSVGLAFSLQFQLGGTLFLKKYCHLSINAAEGMEVAIGIGGIGLADGFLIIM